MKALAVHDFLKPEVPLLDVRSPSEFMAGHIPGAENLPLFSDEERAEVGTLYKQAGREAAIKRGLDIVGPKMSSFITQAESLGSTHLHIHCWRGGMRSQSMAWLLETYGFEISVLEGGYKAYRRTIHDFFSQNLNLNVLSGLTGSQKTEVLLAMKEMGEQVLDLEGIAGHQGSSFGNVLSQGQPTTEQFHNLLFHEAKDFDLSRSIWLEDESFMIGKVAFLGPLHNIKENSPHIVIEIPLKKRLDHLVKGYGDLHKEGLIQATEGIRRKLGHERADEAIALIQVGQLREAAAIILHYYDKQYLRSLEKKKDKIQEKITFEHGDIQDIARHLIHGNS
jgi:tRNA 2-selenouridine synthase